MREEREHGGVYFDLKRGRERVFTTNSARSLCDQPSSHPLFPPLLSSPNSPSSSSSPLPNNPHSHQHTPHSLSLSLPLSPHQTTGGSRTVYVYRILQRVENPLCSLSLSSSLFTSSFSSSPHLYPPLVYNPNKVNIAVHVRWGDVAPSSNDVANIDSRTIGLSGCVTILKAISSLLPEWMSDIYLFAEAEGSEEYFVTLTSIYPSIHFMKGDPSTLYRDTTHLARADVMVIGQSSFAVLSASLNPTGILVVDRDEKYAGWSKYRTQNVFFWSHFSLKEFANSLWNIPVYRRRMRERSERDRLLMVCVCVRMYLFFCHCSICTFI